MSAIQPRKALNKAYLKVKPNRENLEKFQQNLSQLFQEINEAESEEFQKNLVSQFLNETYYKGKNFINTKGQNDLVIHNGKDSKSSVGVILETKKPNNKSEMLTRENLNTKAFQQLLLYFLRDRLQEKNLELKYLIATNIYEWFIFDAQEFEKYFTQDNNLVNKFTDFEAGRLTSKKTDFFYQEIAKPAIENVIKNIKEQITFTYLDLREYQAYLENIANPENQKNLILLYKILSPEHLLKLPFANDSNSLDKKFYSELLHIIGLTEIKKGNKKVIERQPEKNPGTLIENTIIQLESLDKIARLKTPKQFGATYKEQLVNISLELAITWINRILFLKLLEAQIINYHKGDKTLAFLNLEKVPNYHELNNLFFNVLARQNSDRQNKEKEIFAQVPYLNSSLFEPTEIEQETIFISNLRDEKLPIFSETVLKDSQGKKRQGELNSLQYLFEFLDAYDFSTEGSEAILEDNKTLINAAVLGLIFEKINGYQDGAYFTPGFITMYMCSETIRRAVVQKFNQLKGWNCQNIDQLYDKITDKKEANQVINNLKICDPAVGSGHFLVSALNEIIALKSELKILQDRQGKTLRDYQIEVVNDELIITDDDGGLFQYNPTNKESQRIQETLFHEKQTIIENCLFGVDLNPNSVKICQLRLWIELLKNAYYKPESNYPETNYPELETLPNIDINIKCGNSLISRYSLDANLQQALKKAKWNIKSYRSAVQTYRNAENKQQKREMEQLIKEIKSNFTTTLQGIDPKKTELRKLEGELYNLENQLSLFEETAAEKKARKTKITKLNKAIKKLKVEIEEIESGKIYENALEWRFEFPEVLNERGEFVGFDVVIGNPPYVRQEQIKELKPALQSAYECYTGVADLYVYFYEQGLRLLQPQGLLSYISSNKYFRAGYGEKLRQFLVNCHQVELLIDFGDASVFEATVDTSIILLRKDPPAYGTPLNKGGEGGSLIQVLNWTNDISINKLNSVFQNSSFFLEQKQLTPDGWRLESPLVLQLLAKLRNAGTPLGEYVNGRFYYGIKTGFNEAFIVDREIKDKLINEHESSATVLKPFLRGRDVKRWCVDFQDLWLIKIESSENKKHPWSDLPEKEAEQIFANTYPAIYTRFQEYRDQLVKRGDQGKYFWELRACKYWQEFETSKIVYPDIYEKQSFTVEREKMYLANTGYFIPTEKIWMCGLLNSKIVEWFYKLTSNTLGKAMRAFTIYVSQIPIPNATETEKKAIEKLVEKCLEAKGVGVEKWEAEIDERVAHLYGLSEEEMKIIRGE